MKKLKKPKLPGKIKRPFKRAKAPEQLVTEALQNVPRITNETVAEHREEILGTARKYIYPLQHSKHNVVRISLALFVSVVIAFFIYCGLALYKFQSTSTFIYGVARVIPCPVAKAGGSWVSYESYLFELRHFMHYYETQQKVNFATKDGKTQLASFKKRSLTQVINDAYVKRLAAANNVSVNDQEVNNQVELVRAQNRLGSSPHVLETVLSEFWGWNVADFKRELKQQLLIQKVVAKLDTGTGERASQALIRLKNGADFAELAKQVSEDQNTKGTGGEFSGLITESDRDVSPLVVAELFKLKPGQYSDIINTGYTLEIVKVLEVQGNKVRAAHISFTFKDISTYLNPLKAKQKPHRYINS
ncbi:MAG TPA: peptidylprolyl isomerase [Candidatus Saccharimonadales bacterium]|nr:peptidylprolyl isomerase [Candidatus Saccharimonadales bacterium]